MPKKQFKQYVIMEFRNAGISLEVFTSDKKITIDQVLQHYVDTEDFNEDRDNITFVDAPTKVKLK